MKPEPVFAAVESLVGDAKSLPSESTAIVLLSAAGKLFRQETARRFGKLQRIVLICGRYEGVDERIAEHLATDEISVGDFVLSGGELPAAMILDAVTRLIPGALGNEDSALNESFTAENPEPIAEASEGIVPLTWSLPGAPSPRVTTEALGNRGILDCPHYTRPPSFAGRDVLRAFCWAEIIERFGAGGAGRRSRRLSATAPIYWKASFSVPKTNRSFASLAPATRISQVWLAARPGFGIIRVLCVAGCLLAPPERVCRE